MDFSKIKTPDWLMIGGGAAMLILGFVLPWSSVSAFGASSTGDGPFDYFLTGGIAWLLIVAVGILALLRALEKMSDSQPWPLIFLVAAALATLLMLIQLILGGREVLPGFDADRGIGMYGAFVWSAVALAGAYLNFKAAGGELSHLTDMDKLKSSFSGNDSGGEGLDEPPAPPAPPPPPAPEA